MIRRDVATSRVVRVYVCVYVRVTSRRPPYVAAAVAFTAYSTRERVDYYEGERLLFDGVITNLGGGYDPENSLFVSITTTATFIICLCFIVDALFTLSLKLRH